MAAGCGDSIQIATRRYPKLRWQTWGKGLSSAEGCSLSPRPDVKEQRGSWIVSTYLSAKGRGALVT